MLQKRSIRLELDMTERTLDTARFELTLENLAGHKFPSAIRHAVHSLSF